MQTLVKIENLYFTFPGSASPVLRNITWDIGEGSHCALIGANGSGKSTLLSLLAGNLWPTSGRLCWQGPQGCEDSPIYGRSISALVSPAIQENIQRMGLSTTFKDALLGAYDQSPFSFGGMDADDEKLSESLAVAEALDCVNLLTMPLAALSQGQLRILLCARAILRKARLCLLDEALDGLDERRKSAFFGVLEKIAPRTTVILASHRKDAIPDFCLERRYMEGGRLLANPSRLAPKAFAPKQKAPCAAMGGEPLLELENVNVFIDRKQVLHNINWQTRRGEHWRITGPNGSGKSTLLRLIAGDEFAASGGETRRWLPGGQTAVLGDLRQGIRLVSDLSQALYGYDVNGLELVLSGFEQSVGIYRDYTAREQEEARAAICRFFPGKEGQILAQTSIRRLSTGQLRRLYLARALMGQPSILLLDEPCTGLDAQSRAEWFSLLENLSSSMQLIMVSHYDEDVPGFINREAAMSDGRLAIVR